MSDYPTIITDSEHGIDQTKISANATKVLKKLQEAGYDAFLVGGAVRDLLLNKQPKDFDVATSAHPDEVKKVFRNCRLIGRRFRLAHVFFGRDIIEVATFRGQPTDSDDADIGMIKRDNCYGSIEEDAIRRDFSINALYYSPHDGRIIDYVNGYEDLSQGVIRLLGEPSVRYREDPVRMLRAIRFEVKLDFYIEPASKEPISELSTLLSQIPAARLYEEVLKLFAHGHAVDNFKLLRDYHLFEHLFPATENMLGDEEDYPHTFNMQALRNTDHRIHTGLHITPAFLMAVFLWEPVCFRWRELKDTGESDYPALQQAVSEVLSFQIKHVSIPKRHSMRMKDIWFMQYRFDNRRGSRAFRLLENPAFRAAYDFLLLRAGAGHADVALADWWTEFQELDEEAQKKKVGDTYAQKNNNKPFRCRSPRRRNNQDK